MPNAYTVCQTEVTVATSGRGFYVLTDDVERAVAQSGVVVGTVLVFVHHTSASVLINENADPDVRHDLVAFFDRIAPDGDPLYRHVDEGPDDMPAHVRTALTATSVSIPVTAGKPGLGTWQGVFLFEHRRRGHRRRVSLTVTGVKAG